MTKEFKKYDSDCQVTFCGARLTKDAESRDGSHGKMVRLTVVATSRKESYSDLWLEVNVSDFHAELASFLKKGDTLHRITGQLCKRTYGDDNEKVSIVLDRAATILPIELMMECKERGWVPGATSAAPKAGKPAKGKPEKVKAKVKKADPIDIPDEDEDDDTDDE